MSKKLSNREKIQLVNDADAAIVYSLSKQGIVLSYGWTLEDCKLIASRYTDKELSMAISMKDNCTGEYMLALKEEKANRDFEIAIGLRKRTYKKKSRITDSKT